MTGDVAFYVNFHNDLARLTRALGAVRENYHDAPLFAYDDWSHSSAVDAASALLAAHRGFLLRRKRHRAGWEGYYLVRYELLNFLRIFRSTGVDAIFKLDTDTVVCGRHHMEVLRHGGDIVGNTQWLDPACAVAVFLRAERPPSCTVLGGGYFVTSTAPLGRMLARWRAVPRGLRRACGPCQEDQAMAALCWVAGGKVRHSPYLERVYYNCRVETVAPRDYAVHPIKSGADFVRAFGARSA